jgi:hypothetical protein
LKYNESLIRYEDIILFFVDKFILYRNVMIDNQTLFDQMLPPIYQQNNASIMRTNYPGYFTATDAPRRYGTASDAQSDAGPVVC